MLKYGTSVISKLGLRAVVRKCSSTSATVFKSDKFINDDNLPDNSKESALDATKNVNSGLVAAAFASLNAPMDALKLQTQKKTSFKSTKFNRAQQVDAQILNAPDVDTLLVIAESPVVSRRHALKIVSMLSEWSSINKVQLSDFEKDPRFLKLCRILARSPNVHAFSSLSRADDLSTVLGITGDDEAARLIANLSLPQMVKVMKALTQKSRRSTPLLRALAYNISTQAEPLDLKKSADLLYSMAALNFPDSVLLERICSDIMEYLPKNKDKVAVVNSIVVSLGLLKYRHEPLLNVISDWVTSHKDICRPQDLASTVVTLATLHYSTIENDHLLEMAVSIREEDLVKATSWLDLVFSLLILERATVDHLASTLHSEFIEKLFSGGEIPIPTRKKLMAIDAYISLTSPNYSGPRLFEDIYLGIPVVYTKDKQLYVQSIIDTFKSLLSSENFFRKNCNSNMGFLYDGEFAVDDNCHPVPLEKASNNKRVFHIAILGLDYHDMCQRSHHPLGVYWLYTKLLELKGFKVLHIPYTEFNTRDKLITRVQYIQEKIKNIVSNNSLCT